MTLTPLQQDRPAPGLAQEAMREAQSRSSLRTSTGLAYMTTILFFSLVFTIVLFGVGPVVDLNPSPSRGSQAAVPRATITVGGPVAERDIVTITFSSAATGGAAAADAQYAAASGDTPEKMASGLSGVINSKEDLTKAGIKATVSGMRVTILAPPAVDFEQAIKVARVGGVTATLTMLTGASATEQAASANSRQSGPAAAISPARDLIFTLLGVIATGWATIVGYYFGSSSGSAQKTLALAQAAAQKNEPLEFRTLKDPVMPPNDPVVPP